MIDRNRKVLEIENLWKNYRKVQALSGVTLHVGEGETVGFLGPNGAGKTTTISAILGLIQVSKGRIRVMGREISILNVEPLKGVGTLIGQPAFFPHLTPVQNLSLYLPFHPELPHSRIADVLDQVGLSVFANRKAGTFSTGMRQRLGLAFALLHKPRLLILDEPTNGLDPHGINEIRSLLKELASDGMAILLSSHILNEVEQICNRVVFINNGEIISESEITERVATQNLLEEKFMKLIKGGH